MNNCLIIEQFGQKQLEMEDKLSTLRITCVSYGVMTVMSRTLGTAKVSKMEVQFHKHARV